MAHPQVAYTAQIRGRVKKSSHISCQQSVRLNVVCKQLEYYKTLQMPSVTLDTADRDNEA
jgi:hypothetical protein